VDHRFSSLDVLKKCIEQRICATDFRLIDGLLVDISPGGSRFARGFLAQGRARVLVATCLVPVGTRFGRRSMVEPVVTWRVSAGTGFV
jgi:hypothetical protein